MVEPGDDYTSNWRSAGPPVQTDSGAISNALVVVEGADSAQLVGAVTITLRQLVRVVKALPLHRFMPLNDAFAQAKSCLGAGGIAAHDLVRRAQNRQLTVAARRIFSDGTEQVLIFRSVYWQYFTILPPYRDSKVVL